MKCVICGWEETQAALTMELLTRGERGVVIRHVPSHVCANCGEVYHDAAVTRRLLELAEAALPPNELVAVLEYKAA